jgi:hypothetical protein
MKMQHKKNLETINKFTMKRQRITEESILEINIQNQYFVYAQILKKSLGYAFFDYKTKNKITDFEVLRHANVLFILKVYNDIVNHGKWIKVGKLSIRKDLLELPMEFIQDIQNPNNFELYNPNNGEITPATKEQCIGLECCAVWEAEHVESRIADYYKGKQNIWVEQLKIK